MQTPLRLLSIFADALLVAIITHPTLATSSDRSKENDECPTAALLSAISRPCESAAVRRRTPPDVLPDGLTSALPPHTCAARRPALLLLSFTTLP